MKKVFFVLAAAVVMGMTLAACGEKKAAAAEEAQETQEIVIDETMDPGEQLQSLMMQFGDFLKATHISNQEEADAFVAKTLGYKEAIEKVSMDMQKKMEGLEGDEQTAYAAAMIEIANASEEFKKLVEEETTRLKAEAEKAGVSVEDMDK